MRAIIITVQLTHTLSQVDLCFLVDCTGSMGSHIEAVKNNVKELRDDLVKQYKGCDIRFAFVRYTDYDVTSGRTTFIDFTTLVYKPFSTVAGGESTILIFKFNLELIFSSNQQLFHTFVGGISAGGGGDSAEDIMGGLKVAFNSLSWRSGVSRVGQETFCFFILFTK